MGRDHFKGLRGMTEGFFWGWGGKRFWDSRLARDGRRPSVPCMSNSQSTPEAITIRAEPIELSQLLKFAGLFDSGGEAKHAINSGKVTVNGAVETAARKKIFAGTTVACAGRTLVVKL